MRAPSRSKLRLLAAAFSQLSRGARARDQHLLAFEEELLVVAVATRRELSFSCSFSALSHSCDYFLSLVSSEVEANL